MVAALLGLLILVAAGQPGTADQEAIMDRIERIVQLPRGAYPLERYARHYARTADGDVRAVYWIPPGPLPPGSGCAVTSASGDLVQVPCGPMPRYLPAGQRIWLAEEDRLPLIFDGGCGVIELRFDTAAGRIERIACNGEA